MLFDTYLHLFTEWFALLCLEDNKEYISSAKDMETVDGLEVRGEEMEVRDCVIWHYRGAPYKAHILAIHGMH